MYVPGARWPRPRTRGAVALLADSVRKTAVLKVPEEWVESAEAAGVRSEDQRPKTCMPDAPGYGASPEPEAIDALKSGV